MKTLYVSLFVAIAAVVAWLIPVPEAHATGYDGCADGATKHVKRLWPSGTYSCKTSTCRTVGYVAYKSSVGSGTFPQCVVNSSCATTLEWAYQLQASATPAGAPFCTSCIGSGGTNCGGSGWYQP